MLRVILSLLALVMLSACSGDHIYASDDAVARAHYVDAGPPSITLITSVNTRSNTGAHSGLIINGSERVLYDPAGSWEHPAAPERNDLHYGMTPAMLSYYIDFQGSAPFQVVQQTVIVSPEIANQVIAAAIAYGSAPKAECSHAIGAILRGTPGFEGLDTTWFPRQFSKSFAKLPGVMQRTLSSTDGAAKRSLLGGPEAPPAPVPAPAG